MYRNSQKRNSPFKIAAFFIYQLTLFSFPGSAWECMPGGSAAYTND